MNVDRSSETLAFSRTCENELNTILKGDSLTFLLCTGEGGTLVISPNSTWPDLVYYHSFTHANMGWKIHVIDSYTKNGTQIIAHKLSLLIAIAIMLLSLL